LYFAIEKSSKRCEILIVVVGSTRRALWLVTPGHDTIDALLQRREQPQQQPPEK